VPVGPREFPRPAPGLLAPLPPALPAAPEVPLLPQPQELPFDIAGVTIEPIPEGASQEQREQLRGQIQLAHTISVQAALDPDSPGYQEALDRDPGWLFRAADWIQKNIDQPVPGFMSFAIAMLSDPKRNPIEDVADIFDYIFSGDNTEAERILKRVGVVLPTETPETVQDALVQSWRAFGQYQDLRPELFPLEKFIEELLLSPANLIPVGLIGKTVFRTVGKRGGVTNAWSWIARKMSASEFAGATVMTNSGRSARWNEGLEEAWGILFDARDGSQRAVGQLPARRAGQEMVRRLEALRDGNTADLKFLGRWVEEERIKEFRDILRKTNIDFDIFTHLLVRGRKQTPVGVKQQLATAINRRAAGGDTFDIAEEKVGVFNTLSKGGRKIPAELRDELKINRGKIKPNTYFRFTQALKANIVAPLYLGLIPRWTVNDITSNSMFMGLTLEGHFMTKAPRTLLASARAAKGALVEAAGGVAPVPRYASERWGVEPPPFVTEGGGMARDVFGKTEAPLSYTPEVNAGWLDKIPGVGQAVRFNIRTNFASERQFKASLWQKLFSDYATREWKDHIKGMGFPKDIQARLLAFRDPQNFDDIMREFGEFAAVRSPKNLVPVNNIQDPFLQRLMKDHLDQLPDDIDVDDLAESILGVGEDYVRHMEDAADGLQGMGPNLQEASEAWARIEGRALDDMIRDAGTPELATALRKLKAEEADFGDDFIKSLREKWNRIDAAKQRIADRGGVQLTPILARMQSEIREVELRGMNRDMRITSRYYDSLRRLGAAQLDKAEDLRRARAVERTASTDEMVKAVEDLEGDFGRLIAQHGLTDDIPLDALMASKKISDVQFKSMLEEAGLDTRLFATDTPPDISQLLRAQRVRVMRQLDDTMGDFREAMEANTAALRRGFRPIDDIEASAVAGLGKELPQTIDSSVRGFVGPLRRIVGLGNRAGGRDFAVQREVYAYGFQISDKLSGVGDVARQARDALGRQADSPAFAEYRQALGDLLRKEFGDEISVFRGSGLEGGIREAGEYVSVTTSGKTAAQFGQRVQRTFVRPEDVVMLGNEEESELLIRAAAFLRREITGNGLPDDELQSLRRLMNEVKGRSSVRATERTEEAFYNYSVRNKFDYLLNHFAPFPFWSTRYITSMVQRSIEEPRIARGILRILGEWNERVQDDPVEARFSMATPFTTPGGSVVRFNPLYALMPLGSPAISFIQFGSDWKDLSQGMADVADFMGAYFYPHVELVASALDGGLGLERTGGVGMVRSAKEIALDLSPIGGLAVLGMNTFGYDFLSEQTGDALVTERTKGRIIQALGNDVDLGRISQDKAKEAVHSIQIGRPNAMATIYARKALGHRITERISGMLGFPIKLIPPELDQAERDRKWMFERPKTHPLQLKGTQTPMHPDLMRMARDAYPGLEVVSGQRIPVGLTREGEKKYRMVQDLFREVDGIYSEREKKLTEIMGWFNDPKERYDHSRMWEERRKVYAEASARVKGAEDAMRARALRDGIPGLPIEPEERRLFWATEGRDVYPVHPIRLVYERFLAIEAEEFPQDVGHQPDFEEFYKAREAFLHSLSGVEREYIMRRLSDPTSPDADVKRAIEVLKPYWGKRDELIELFPDIMLLDEEIALAEKAQDIFRQRMLERNPQWKAFNARVADEKEKLRTANPLLEHYATKYLGLVPLRFRRR
jgi:hypothetical protein